MNPSFTNAGNLNKSTVRHTDAGTGHGAGTSAVRRPDAGNGQNQGQTQGQGVGASAVRRPHTGFGPRQAHGMGASAVRRSNMGVDQWQGQGEDASAVRGPDAGAGKEQGQGQGRGQEQGQRQGQRQGEVAAAVRRPNAGVGQREGEGASVIAAPKPSLQNIARTAPLRLAGYAAPSSLLMTAVLVARLDAGQFRSSMDTLRTEVGTVCRLQASRTLKHGDISAYRTGAAFHLIQSAASVAAKLRAELAEAGIPALRDEATIVMAFLRLGGVEQSPADHLSGAIMQQPQALSPKKKADFHRLVGNAVKLLPTALWPPHKPSLRSELLAELKRRNMQANGLIVPTHPNPVARLVSKLRRLLASANNKYGLLSP